MTWEVLLAGKTITSPKHQEYQRGKPRNLRKTNAKFSIQSRKEVKQNTNTTHALLVVYSITRFQY